MIKVTKDQPGMAVCTKFDGDDYEGCSLCEGPHIEVRPDECWWTGARVTTTVGTGRFVERVYDFLVVEMDARYLIWESADRCKVEVVR